MIFFRRLLAIEINCLLNYRVFFAIAFCGQMVGNISSFIPDVVKVRILLLFQMCFNKTQLNVVGG